MATEEERSLRARMIGAQDEAERLRGLLDDLVEYVTPCDKDEGRDYCMIHHEFSCPANALVFEARKAVEVSA